MTDDESDFIDLSQVIRVLWSHRLLLISAVLFGLACAAIAYVALPAKWRASATLQIGQMPASSAARDATLIEPPAQLVEKFKLRDAEILALAGFKLEQASDKSAALLTSTLKATSVKNTNLIQLSVAGYSAEEAQKNIDAAIQIVIDEHAALVAPAVERLADQIEANARQIAVVTEAKQKAQSMLNKIGSSQSAAQFGPAIVAMQLVENKDAELRRLETERLLLDDMAAPTKTFVTKVVNAAQVEPRPYFPNLKLFLALGLFLGGLIGCCLAFYREWRSKLAA